MSQRGNAPAADRGAADTSLAGDTRSNSTALTTEEVLADRLPALIDRARSKLAEARTSAEVLEAKHVAEAALHFARVTDAANEAHADCLRIITRAEIRLAREIDAAQERGEVERAGGDRVSTIVRAADNGPAAIGDLGLDRRRVAEWRDLAAAGEQAVDAAIDEVVEEARTAKRVVTKEAIRRKVAKTTPMRSRRPGATAILADPDIQMAGDILDFLCRVPVDKFAPAEATEIAEPKIIAEIDRYVDVALPWVANFSDVWRERGGARPEPFSPARDDLLSGIVNSIWVTKGRKPELTIADLRAALNAVFQQIASGLFSRWGSTP
jgi:hypothetical protein